MLKDDSHILFGKYKFTRLHSVPPEYLLQLYENKKNNKELLDYIEVNLEKIKARVGVKIVDETVLRECNKFQYPTEKDAKYELNKMRKLNQEHKKPVRCYECPKCGGWHLTSISFEDWRP